MKPALQAVSLTYRFGGLTAVNAVSIDIVHGELHAVIGPNGAGKSTLLDLLSGERRPHDGQLLLDGVDVTGWPVWRRARAGIGRSFQRTDVMRELTVRENARLAAQARLVSGRGVWRRAERDRATVTAAHDALARVGLAAACERPAASLSHGELRQLEIAMALAAGPRVLLLDEPMAGIGPEETSFLATLLRDLVRDHALLLVEHDMDVVFAVADRITVLLDGRVLETGTPESIRASASVRVAYLGHAA